MALVLVLPALSEGQTGPEVRQILALQSPDRGSMVFDQFTDRFRVGLLERAGQPVTVTEFVVTPAGFTEAPEKPTIAFPQSLLAEQAPVGFRAPGLWRDYRSELLLILGAFALQSLLIIGLLYQRRARRKAEDDSRRSLALAADANRRLTMLALTGSIAHELSQLLSSILHNAQAGEMLVASNRATPDTLHEILTDIRAANVRATEIIQRHRAMLRNRDFDKRPVDIEAVVRDSLALIAHEAKAEQVSVEAGPAPEPCRVTGDPILLQQVLVNLLMNGIEAMAQTPPERRRIQVQPRLSPEGVTISVRDAGSGLPPDADGQLFEPFVTTKANGIGIGLTIAKAIVETHGGSLVAHNNRDAGATFVVTLPRDVAPGRPGFAAASL